MGSHLADELLKLQCSFKYLPEAITKLIHQRCFFAKKKKKKEPHSFIYVVNGEMCLMLSYLFKQ